MTFIFKRSRNEESVMSKGMGKNDGFVRLMEAQFNNKRIGIMCSLEAYKYKTPTFEVKRGNLPYVISRVMPIF